MNLNYFYSWQFNLSFQKVYMYIKCNLTSVNSLETSVYLILNLNSTNLKTRKNRKDCFLITNM